jgi:hypothetical protein
LLPSANLYHNVEKRGIVAIDRLMGHRRRLVDDEHSLAPGVITSAEERPTLVDHLLRDRG